MSMREPRLSIIMPCHNEAAGIVAALAALQVLRQRGAELIVVDGESRDATANLATGLADRVLTAARGRSTQMNAGAAAARGAVLLFLHMDCALPADADRLITDGLRASGKAWGRFDVRLAGSHPLLPVIACTMNWRSRSTGIATGDQGMFVTRDLFAQAGNFPAIALMEDIAMSRQLKARGPPLCLRERIVTSARRWEERGVLRTILLMWRLRLAYFLGVDPAKLALRYDSVHPRN